MPLRQIWRSAQAAFSQRQGWLVQLHDDQGNVGLGDCAPLLQAGTESSQQAQAQLEGMIHRFKGREPESVFVELDAFVSTPAARCGVEMALIDLMARVQNVSAAHWLNPNACESVEVNQNAGTPAAMLASAAEPFTGIIKLKVGLLGIHEELAQLGRLAQQFPAQHFRLDANQAWNMREAEQFIQGCKNLPVEAIEEPLENTNFDALADLQAQAVFPLALDESLANLDWSALLSHKPVKRLVLKPMREGGIVVAREKAQQVQAVGMECVLTTTLDSAVGVWATVHLAAALGMAGQGLAHGLATSSWLERDLGPAPMPVGGRIYLPDRPGFGIDLDQIIMP